MDYTRGTGILASSIALRCRPAQIPVPRPNSHELGYLQMEGVTGVISGLFSGVIPALSNIVRRRRFLDVLRFKRHRKLAARQLRQGIHLPIFDG